MRRLEIIVFGVILMSAPLASAAPDGSPQDIIDAAFGLQEDGATLAQVRGAMAPHAGDDAIDFAMGAVDFLHSAEYLIQQAHRHGFLTTFRQVSSMVGPQARVILWIANDDPEPTRLQDLDAAVLEWTSLLATADETLTAVEQEFTCAIRIPSIRLDINDDGRTTSAESLRALFNLFPSRNRWDQETGQRVTTPLVPDQLTVNFDRGDAAWLRGYCNLLGAVGDWLLAHDAQEVWDHTGHVFFPKAEIKYDFLPGSTFSLERIAEGMQTPAPFDLTDLIAFIGNMRLPVDEPERMVAALEHLRGSVALGQEMWSFYDREQDDDREWIPNPRQTAAFHEVLVDESMRDSWLLFLDEADAILGGRKVLRFWRGDGTRGIDVPLVFTEPRAFDLLYWVQGSAAGPYLREGEFTTPGTWAQLERTLDRRVFRYSFWFN